MELSSTARAPRTFECGFCATLRRTQETKRHRGVAAGLVWASDAGESLRYQLQSLCSSIHSRQGTVASNTSTRHMSGGCPSFLARTLEAHQQQATAPVSPFIGPDTVVCRRPDYRWPRIHLHRARCHGIYCFMGILLSALMKTKGTTLCGAWSAHRANTTISTTAQCFVDESAFWRTKSTEKETQNRVGICSGA